ncbi:MAG: TrkA family potassium uptake protein [Methanomassiliicoccales archaeon]|nr:MAG: TrkA family potassium uptake protein [Methanomassiliicoccales archaeon]
MTKVIVCGYGTVGRKVVEELRKAGVNYCVIDRKSEVFKDEVFKYIVGDSMKKRVLKAAGASSAQFLIACTDTDETNIFTILVAKGLNPKLRIFAVGKKSESIKKLYIAGAEAVVSSSAAGGRAISKHAIIPHVAEFVDRITLTKDVHITDLVISPKSRLVNVQLKNSRIRENTGVSILAIQRGKQLIPNPPSTTVLHANETLIVMGNREQIKLLSRITKG